MQRTVPLVVVLDNVLDADEAFLTRLDIFDYELEIAVCLIATVFYLLVVIGMSRDQVHQDLIGNEVLPVCAGDRSAVAEHDLGGVEVVPALLEQMLHRMVSERLDRLRSRRYNLRNRRIRARRSQWFAASITAMIAAFPAMCSRAGSPVCIAVHDVGGGGPWGWQRRSSTHIRTTKAKQQSRMVQRAGRGGEGSREKSQEDVRIEGVRSCYWVL